VAKPGRKLLPRILLAGGAAALALAGAEAGMRAYLVSKSGATDFASYRRRCLGEQLAIFEQDAAGELTDLRPGQHQGKLITINRQGFRGAPALEPKPADGFRIVCIGGSGCFGTTSSGDAATFPAFLEKSLRENANDPAAVEVLNGGLPGATTALAITRFEQRLRPLRPDLVILYNLINDILQSRRAKLGLDPRMRPLVPVSGPVSSLLSHSAIYLAIVSARTEREKAAEIAEANRAQADQARGTPAARERARAVEQAVTREQAGSGDANEKNLYLVPEHVAEFRAQLERFARLARQSGATPVFCTFAMRFRGDETQREYQENGPATARYMPDWKMAWGAIGAMNDVIRETARATGSPLVDVAAKIPKKPEYFPPGDTDHFTDAGCAAAGALIAAELRSQGLLARGALAK
jgi:lysophospholipase L1-like esterase